MAEGKSENTNYRKYYVDSLAVSLSASYEVHHIDRDRGNNSLMNLVAIPKEFHTKVHKVLNRYDWALNWLDEMGYFYSKEEIEILVAVKNYINLKTELWPYIEKRNQLIIDNKNFNG